MPEMVENGEQFIDRTAAGLLCLNINLCIQTIISFVCVCVYGIWFSSPHPLGSAFRVTHDWLHHINANKKKSMDSKRVAVWRLMLNVHDDLNLLWSHVIMPWSQSALSLPYKPMLISLISSLGSWEVRCALSAWSGRWKWKWSNEIARKHAARWQNLRGAD